MRVPAAANANAPAIAASTSMIHATPFIISAPRASIQMLIAAAAVFCALAIAVRVVLVVLVRFVSHPEPPRTFLIEFSERAFGGEPFSAT